MRPNQLAFARFIVFSKLLISLTLNTSFFTRTVQLISHIRISQEHGK